MAGILVAKDTLVIEYEGERVFFHKGKTLVREGHPMLKGIEEYFEPITVDYDTVEQATAAPGEKRTTRRGRPPLPRDDDGNIVRDPDT